MAGQLNLKRTPQVLDDLYTGTDSLGEVRRHSKRDSSPAFVNPKILVFLGQVAIHLCQDICCLLPHIVLSFLLTKTHHNLAIDHNGLDWSAVQA
jgi:hypothetical protein